VDRVDDEPIGFEQPTIVEPVDPFERGVPDGLKVASWPTPVDHFGFVEAYDFARRLKTLRGLTP